MSITRRAAFAAMPALGLPLAAASAQSFPERNLRYIVPFPPAGLTDIMARLVAERLSETLGQPVVVENRAGGNAMIGADAAARAAPDGHTLLAITMTHTVNATLFPNATYTLMRDFRPISVLGSLPLVVCVNVNNPARTLQDLIGQARAGVLNGGSSGNGSPPHLGLELFRRVSGAAQNVNHIPYRGGAPSVTDLAGGTLDLLVSNLPECLPQVRGGRLRALAITSEARHRLLPDVPTVAEAGAPDMTMTNWTAVLTNSAVPEAAFVEISRAVQSAMRHADTRRRAEDGGFDVLGWEPDRSRVFMASEVARWADLIRAADIRVEG